MSSLAWQPAGAREAPRFGRLVEVDFFRGLVLLMIVVDHISGSVVSHVTLHAYALCDAAEVFVFLGGFAAASAYLSLAARQSHKTARLRFLKRAVELYRAFLVTALLMLGLSALLFHYQVLSPNLAFADLYALGRAPLLELADVLTFRSQPYLSAILPMYVVFALLIPVAVPLARRRPGWLVFASVLIWALSPLLAAQTFGRHCMIWSFNPFAWQMMFAMGVLARCQPLHARLAGTGTGKVLTCLAVAVALGCAYYKLGSSLPLPEGEFKRDLAAPRVVSFMAIAWLMAECMRFGWIRPVAERLQPIVTVGRRGLVCFVAGTGISLTLDALLRHASGADVLSWHHLGAGLAADICALGLLVMIAMTDSFIAQRRTAPA